MRHVERILAHTASQRGKISERASHAYKLSFRVKLVQPINRFELLPEKLRDLAFRLLRSNVRSSEHFRKRRGAEGKNLRMQNVAAVVIHEFGTGAAYFHNQPLGDFHRIYHALIDEIGFLLFGNHFEFESRRAEHLVEKGALIFRATHRRCRHGENFVHAEHSAKLFEHLYRVYCLHNPRLFERAVYLRFSETHRFHHFVRHHKVAAFKHVEYDETSRI